MVQARGFGNQSCGWRVFLGGSCHGAQSTQVINKITAVMLILITPRIVQVGSGTCVWGLGLYGDLTGALTGARLDLSPKELKAVPPPPKHTGPIRGFPSQSEKELQVKAGLAEV